MSWKPVIVTLQFLWKLIYMLMHSNRQRGSGWLRPAREVVWSGNRKETENHLGVTFIIIWRGKVDTNKITLLNSVIFFFFSSCLPFIVYHIQPTTIVYHIQPTTIMYHIQPASSVYHIQPTIIVYNIQVTTTVYHTQPTTTVYIYTAHYHCVPHTICLLPLCTRLIQPIATTGDMVFLLLLFFARALILYIF